MSSKHEALACETQLKIEHKVVDGRLAELVWAWPFGDPDGAPCSLGEPLASRGALGPLIAVIPGFPGGAQIYRDFLITVADDASCPAVCVAWSGQHPPPSSAEKESHARPPCLEEQVDFAVSVLNVLRHAPFVSEVVLVGHSFGAWIACSALAVLDGGGSSSKGAVISQVHLFCPVLESFASIPRAQRLRPHIYRARSCGLGRLLRLLTSVVPLAASAVLLRRIWWLRGKTTLGDEELQFFRTLVAHIRAGVVGRALELVVEAFEGGIGTQGGLWEPLRRRGKAVCLHYAAVDGWTPPEVQARLVGPDRLPEARRAVHAMPHGIITSRAGAAVAARGLVREIAVGLAAAAQSKGSSGRI